VQRHAPGGEGGISHGLTDLFLFLQNVPSEPMAAPALVGGRPRSMRNRGTQPTATTVNRRLLFGVLVGPTQANVAASTRLGSLVGRVLGA
jgi:hypothetical protein